MRLKSIMSKFATRYSYSFLHKLLGEGTEIAKLLTNKYRLSISLVPHVTAQEMKNPPRQDSDEEKLAWVGPNDHTE